MTAVGKIHTHNGIAGLEHCKENRKVSTRTRMGLNVAIFTAEYLLDTVAG